jgi:tRNA A37 methylthiotransferase MiaB
MSEKLKNPADVTHPGNNKPLDILFVNLPPISPVLSENPDPTSSSHLFPPLGILSLASGIRDCKSVASMKCADFTIYNLDKFETYGDLELFVENTMREIAGNTAPSVISISLVFSSAYDFFQLICNAVSRCWKDAIVIVGGIHASNTVAHCLENNPSVDYVLCGEGEVAFPLLLEAISAGIEPEITGVHSRTNIKRGLTTPYELAKHVENLDIDFTIYPKILDMDLYTRKMSLFSLSKTTLEVNSFAMMASRGCPGRCTFCAAHTVHGRRPRWRSLENVLAEIRWLNTEYGVTKIYLMDDNFVPRQKALDLFSALANIGIPGFEIVIQNLSINNTNHDLIDAIVNVGINNVAYAIESGSPAVQKRIKKLVDLEKAVDIVAYSKSKGLNVRCFYIIGFPSETRAEMQETFEYARRIGANWSNFNVAMPIPGSEMYAEFVSMGLIEAGPKSWGATSIRDRVFDTPEISATGIKEMAYRMNLDMNFIRNINIQEGDYTNGKTIFENFVKSFDFHIFAYDCLRRIAMLTGNYKDAGRILRHMKHLMETNPKSQAFRSYFDLLDAETRAYLE